MVRIGPVANIIKKILRMKIGPILISGLMTGSIGFVLAMAVNEIGARDLNKYRYESNFYQYVEKYRLIIGAGLGFAVGAGQECVRGLKENKEED